MMKGKLLIALLVLFLVASCANTNKAPDDSVTPSERPVDGGWPQVSIGLGIFS